MDKKKIQRAVKLYPLYEAASGDLLFYSVIMVLFMTLVKGFSASDIALILLISDGIDLLLEYPSYILIKKLGNSRSVILGGIMPVISILLVTFGQDIVTVTIGNIFFVSAGNFQSIASAGIRNNLSLIGEKDRFAKLISKSTLLYSVLCIASAVIIPFLFSYNRYIPSALCFLLYVSVAVISFLIPDYSEEKSTWNSDLKDEKREMKSVKLSSLMKYLLAVFCLFFCAIIIYANNCELILSDRLGRIFSENKVILIFGAIVWVGRMVKLITNIFLEKILNFMNDRIIVSASVTLLLAFALTGLTGLITKNYLLSVILIGILYVIVKGIIWDPMRTFLRIMAVDTNNKRKQQKMLMLLNAGQSVTNIIMRLIVFVTMKAFSLEYVFLIFAGLMVVEFVLAVRFAIACRNTIVLLNMKTILTEEEIDHISDAVVQVLSQQGLERKTVSAYRLLIEEKLGEALNEENRNKKVNLMIDYNHDEYKVKLFVDGNKKDVFAMSQTEDTFSNVIYKNIIRGMEW